MKLKLTFTIIICCIFNSCQNKISNTDRLILEKWIAGKEISIKSVELYGYENCFSSNKIDDKIFQRINGKSFKKNCTTPLSELRYIKILHYNINGNILLGEIICHQSISNDLLEIFRTLYDAHYPIERMVLIDEYNADDEASMSANNSSAFNFRLISGTNKLSKHSLGLAIDINPLYNPFVAYKTDSILVEPQAGYLYVDRNLNYPYKINKNDLCYREFIKHGFEWGGDWSNRKDYQHFEKK